MNKVEPTLVCNNVIDCMTAADERNCPNSSHYYCWRGDVMFVNLSSTFNQIRECSDGSDECPDLFTGGALDYAFRNHLIRNPLLQVIVWIVSVLSLGGNAIVIVHTTKELWRDRRLSKLGRLAKCNRTFVLNLAVADFLMGVYLITLGITTATKENRYCSDDREWRTSQLCSLMGILSQFSSQTSVLLLVLM
uniref:G-protein coupled receptors family 1 profile domain-containing protein n=1 Tax=Ciona savignyi TaxID=51511 RepID=H2ZCK4_CIOSA